MRASTPAPSPIRALPPALLLAAVGVVAQGCAGRGPVLIGVVLPRSGAGAVQAAAVERGMELAIDQLGAAHARGEYPLELALGLRDSAGRPEQAARALEELYDSGAAVAIGGVTSREAEALAVVATRAERVLVSPAAGGEEGEAVGSRWVYRLFPSCDREGSKLASFAALELRVERTAVVAPAAEEAVAESFAHELERNRGRVVSRVAYRPSALDAERVAREALGARPQAVLVAGPGEAVASIVQRLRRQGHQGAILTTSGFAAPGMVASAGRHAEGVLLARPMFDAADDRPAVRAFVEGFRGRYGEEPDLWAAYGYDAVRVLAEALAGSRSPGEAWSGLRRLEGYEGVTGPIQFDEAGRAAAFPRVYVVSGGAMKQLAELSDGDLRRLYRRAAALPPRASSLPG